MDLSLNYHPQNKDIFLLIYVNAAGIGHFLLSVAYYYFAALYAKNVDIIYRPKPKPVIAVCADVLAIVISPCLVHNIC